MSRARRQQRKRARRWALEVRDTVYGWRASWWFKGREMHPAYHFPKVENRFRKPGWAGLYETGRSPSKPELQRFPLRTEQAKALHDAIEKHARMSGLAFETASFDYATVEARIAARVREGGL